MCSVAIITFLPPAARRISRALLSFKHAKVRQRPVAAALYALVRRLQLQAGMYVNGEDVDADADVDGDAARACRHRLCDSLGDAYPEPYQTAFQRGRTAALPRHECPVAGMRPALHQNPPTISAATWAAQVGAALTASLAACLPCCRSVHQRPCV